MAGTADIAKKAARVAALNVKLANGTITEAEKKELQELIAGAPEMQPGYVPPKTPDQVKAEFDAMRAKAAEAETAKQRAAAVAVTPAGPVVKPVPAVKPEDMQVNPALVDALGPAPTAPAPAATPVEPQWDANGWAFIDGKWVAGPNAKYAADQKTPAPAPAVAAPAPAVAEPDQRGYGDRTREFEEAMSAIPQEDQARLDAAQATVAAAKSDPDATPADVKKASKSFGDMAKELATKFGVPLLGLIQAYAYGKAGVTKPTYFDEKYKEKLAVEQREYEKKLAEEQRAYEEGLEAKRTKAAQDEAALDRAFRADQAALERLAQKEALGQQLSSEEKIAKMQLEGRIQAAKASGMTVDQYLSGE